MNIYKINNIINNEVIVNLFCIRSNTIYQNKEYIFINNSNESLNINDLIIFKDNTIHKVYNYVGIARKNLIGSYVIDYNIDFIVIEDDNIELEINNHYEIFFTNYNNNYNILAINPLVERSITAKKLSKIDRFNNLTYFYDNFDNVYCMNSKDFLIRDKYIVYGYIDNDIFYIKKHIDLIEAIIKINNVYNYNDSNFYAFCKAEFLSYPPSKKIESENLFISGIFESIFKDDDFKVIGYWYKTKTGVIFKILESERVFSVNLKTMKNYLLLSLKGNNIGKVTIDRIVTEYGLNTINIIKNNPEKLLNIKGISENKMNIIHEKILSSQYIENIISYFVKNNIPIDNMKEIYDKYGISTIETIQNNPYTLLELRSMSFKKVDKLAKKEGFKYNDENRIKAGILSFLKNDELSNGNLFTYEDILYDNLNEFLTKDKVFEEEISYKDITKSLEELKLNKLIIEEHLISDYNKKCLYLSYNNFLENKIVEKLRTLKNSSVLLDWNKDMVKKEIDIYEKNTGFKLASNQKKSIVMALMNNISILTGGPGTGKTQTVNAIIHIAKQLKSDIVIDLTAPTGKASDRLTEITGMNATTIHRKLGYIPFDNEAELKEIESDLLVIDESSMIDADLFYKLLYNISDTTKILFVGDYNQIPSVGAGLILRDLINSKEIETTILNEVFRQSNDSTIVDKSYNIINGITSKNGLNLENTNDFIFIQEENDYNIKSRILEIVKKEKENYHINEIQVLTPMNVGNLGTNILNYELQNLINPYISSENDLRLSPTKIFRVKDKVMQTRNNYDINVFNGTLGNIINVNKDTKLPLTVEYDLEDVEYSYKDAEDLMLAYAMTIHKSQGSEFDVVIIPIHKSHLFMSNRNLLYTAITRAKKKVYLVGDKEILDKIIIKEDFIKRNSQIKEKLRKEKTVIPF